MPKILQKFFQKDNLAIIFPGHCKQNMSRYQYSNIWTRQCEKLRQTDTSSSPYNSGHRSPRTSLGSPRRFNLARRVALSPNSSPRFTKKTQKKGTEPARQQRIPSRAYRVVRNRRADTNAKTAQNGEEKCRELLIWLLTSLAELKGKCDELLNNCSDSEDEA